MLPVAMLRPDYTGSSLRSKGKLSSAFEKAGTSAAYPYGAMNLIPTLEIRFRIANSCTRCMMRNL
jgi:hypothetical protein